MGLSSNANRLRYDKYIELAIDPEIKEIIVRGEEPSSQHKGHGSVKNKASNGAKKH